MRVYCKAIHPHFYFDSTREIYYFAFVLTYTPGMNKPMRKTTGSMSLPEFKSCFNQQSYEPLRSRKRRSAAQAGC